MPRLVLLACLFAAAAAVPTQGSDTEFCNGIRECPADCGYVSRNERCVYCRCGDNPFVRPVPMPLPEPEPQCKYGPAIIDECDNDCKCIGNGRYGCSRKLCMPGQRPEEPKTCSRAQDLPKRDGQRVFCHDGIVKVQSLDAKCLPDAVFMDEEDCNSCRCSSNGMAACTLKFCPKDVERQPQCKYGPAIIDECDNDCKCIGNGRYGCSRKLCMPGQRPEEPKTCSRAQDLPKREGQRVFCHDGIVKVQSLDAKCLPDAVFMDEEDCNSCRCSSNGMAACTLKLCPKDVKKPPAAGCPYGPSFIDECGNDCNCVDGRLYGCTFKACQPGEEAGSPKKCTSYDNLPSRPGARVFCDEGVVKLQKIEAGCEHGPGFIDECNNDCSCVNGQFYGCTLKACKPGETAQSPMKCTSSDYLPSRPGVRVFCDEGIVKTQQPVCPHGSEFIDECGNDCRCLEDGYACTLKSCKPGQTSMKPMACQGAKDLPRREGRRVICHENITKIQDEGDVCLPGSVYALECNSCFCSETGQSGCTLKACIGEPTASTVTCEDGLPSCPADCGQVYNELRDCYECPCSVGKPGDVAVNFEESCPPGTVYSDSGAFFRTCKPSDKCPHGLAFIDECDNDCECMAGGYGCTRKACLAGQEATKPKQCKGSAQLPERKDKRVFCHEGVVKVQGKDDGCLPGSVFKQDCNSCFCGANGQSGCTFKECLANSR